MNKSELLNSISDLADLPLAKAAAFLKAFQETVTAELQQGRQVVLVGFGTFQTVHRAAREGRNPSTGKSISIKPARVPKFRAGAILRRSVN